jgi:hypothetical protein
LKLISSRNKDNITGPVHNKQQQLQRKDNPEPKQRNKEHAENKQ